MLGGRRKSGKHSVRTINISQMIIIREKSMKTYVSQHLRERK
jgi:hypothetical protein